MNDTQRLAPLVVRLVSAPFERALLHVDNSGGGELLQPLFLW